MNRISKILIFGFLAFGFSAYGQVKLLSELKVSDEVMFFDGERLGEVKGEIPNSTTGYDYVYGNALTPHGDCVKAFKEFVFLTWYRGGKEDRHVMLSRYNTITGVTKTIEFPHQHIGYNGQWWVGETHNTIAVGICPKDSSIHMLYDMHRNGEIPGFEDDYLNYSYSYDGAATVPDEEFSIERFVNSPTNNYKHLAFEGINDVNTTKKLTYPAFFTNDEGDLFMKMRFGWDKNGKFIFAKFNGEKWIGYTDFNRLGADGFGSPYSWGLYGDIKYLNGKIRVGFQQRANIRDDKYWAQNGIYYAYSDDPAGLNEWYNYKGEAFQRPIAVSDDIKIEEPGDFVETTQTDMVKISSGFDYTVTDNGDVHFVSQVKDAQYNVTKKLHTYRKAGEIEFTTEVYNAGSALYAAGNDVYVIGLQNGRVNIVKTKGGTNDFQQVYQHSEGPSFNKGVVNVYDGKLYYYLKESGGTGDKRTTYLQIFDLDIDRTPVDTAYHLSFDGLENGQEIEHGSNLSIKANVGSAYTEVSLWNGDANLGTLTHAPFVWENLPQLSNMVEPSYQFTLVAIDSSRLEAKKTITLIVPEKVEIDSLISNLIFYYPLERNGNDHSGNNKHATMGSAVTYASAKYGDGASFTYTEGSYFTSADSVFEYSGPTAYTIAFWLKVSDYSQRGDILQPTNGRTLLYSNGDLNFRCSHQKKTISFAVNEGEKNDWFHVALLLDQREGQRKHQVLINGQQSGDIAEGYDFDTGKPQSIGKLIFGAFSATSLLRNFTGMLDEVCMFNDVLSEAEVKVLMNAENIKEHLSAPTSIQYVSASNKLHIFPNPATQNLTIVGAEVRHVEVFTISGKMIKSTPLKQNFLDISSLENGMYILKVLDESGNVSINSFIKQY